MITLLDVLFVATLCARTAVSEDVDNLVDGVLEDVEYFIQLLVDTFLAISRDNDDSVNGSLLEFGDPFGIELLGVSHLLRSIKCCILEHSKT